MEYFFWYGYTNITTFRDPCFEDANSKLVEVASAADVDAEKQTHIFGHKAEFLFRFVQVW